MDGVHDLGGMHGFGPVPVEADEPVFRAEWERRAFGLGFLVGSRIGVDGDRFRHAIERLPAVVYLSAGYYERWILALQTLLEETGTLAPGEIEARMASVPSSKPPTGGPRVEGPDRIVRSGESDRRDGVGTPARFREGDRVLTTNDHPSGHTRLPRYAMGRAGTVVKTLGVFKFPDANARGEGECPQHCYSVRFEASELWGRDGHERDATILDLWESHLLAP